jgi:hypothetical protein
MRSLIFEIKKYRGRIRRRLIAAVAKAIDVAMAAKHEWNFAD